MKKTIKSVMNFRDLGGIETKDGKKIKKGYFLRGGHLGELKEKDIEKLRALGISAVFDYREEDEKTLDPDKDISAENFHIPALKTRMDTPVVPSELRGFLKGLTAEREKSLTEEFIASYKDIPFDNVAYKETFKAINELKPIYFHCTAGKDRTGIMAALILLAFNVSREDIVKNYMLSNKYRFKENWKNMLKVKIGTRNKCAHRLVREITFCQPKFIEAAMDAIFQKYPNYEDFLQNEYQISKEDLAKWRSFYLE